MMRQQFLAVLGLLFAANVWAGSPVWTFLALTPTTVSLPENSTVTVKYSITNQSTKTHTLAMKPITGVTQTTTSGNCANPFTLTAGSSCILTLEVNGSQLTTNLTSGPVVCVLGSDLMCYQPSAADSLNVTPIASSSVATLQVLNTAVDLFNGGMNQTITVKNTSLDLTATNLTFSFAGTVLEPFVTEVSNSCSSVAPQGTCSFVESDALHATVTSPTTVTATLQSADGNSEVVPVTVTQYSVGDLYGTNGRIAALSSSNAFLNLVIGITLDRDSWFRGELIPQALEDADSNENGQSNTSTILDVVPIALDAEAAYFCDENLALNQVNGVSYRYFLPARDQLAAITRNASRLDEVVINEPYWSSTVLGSSLAVYLVTFDGLTVQIEHTTWLSRSENIVCAHLL